MSDARNVTYSWTHSAPPATRCRESKLRATLPVARNIGLDRLLVTCADTNTASITVIERCGGELAETRVRQGHGLTLLYWIDLAAAIPTQRNT